MLRLSRATYDTIIAQAYAEHTQEICGILAGGFNTAGDASVVTDAYETANVASTPETRYHIDPEEQFSVSETIEDRGLDIVGFYHSHPAGPPHPSQTDATEATWPDRSYVICSLAGYPFVGSWRWRDDTETFEQETVVVRTSD